MSENNHGSIGKYVKKMYLQMFWIFGNFFFLPLAIFPFINGGSDTLSSLRGVFRHLARSSLMGH